jgi:hypothetical protein
MVLSHDTHRHPGRLSTVSAACLLQLHLPRDSFEVFYVQRFPYLPWAMMRMVP